MLVLSRKAGERVLIPELNIAITIVNTGPGRVRLGIEAPREILITRPEIRHRATDSGSRPAVQRRRPVPHCSMGNPEETRVCVGPAVG